MRRERDGFTLKALGWVLQDRAIVLGKDHWADFDSVVGLHRQNVRVEGSAVDRSLGHTVRNDRLTPLAVLLDVRGFQEWRASEPAQSAAHRKPGGLGLGMEVDVAG